MFAVAQGRAVRCGDHPLGQIIDFAKSVAPRDGKLACAPQPFQRRF
jgi:hypothetical protein